MDKYEQNQDLRVLRTRQSIHDAFLELISYKKFEDITVSELAKEAGINRKTFYLHYASTSDLLDEVLSDITTVLSELFIKYDLFSPNFDPYPVFLELNERILKELTLHKNLFRFSSSGNAVARVQRVIINTLVQRYEKLLPINRNQLEYYTEYTAAGLTALYFKWLSAPAKEQLTSEELAHIAAMVTYNGYDEIIANLQK